MVHGRLIVGWMRLPFARVMQVGDLHMAHGHLKARWACGTSIRLCYACRGSAHGTWPSDCGVGE